MARAAMPLLTLIALWLCGLESPGIGRVLAVMLTGIGCCISAYGEVGHAVH
jgi:hypothetical protein